MGLFIHALPNSKYSGLCKVNGEVWVEQERKEIEGFLNGDAVREETQRVKTVAHEVIKELIQFDNESENSDFVIDFMEELNNRLHLDVDYGKRDMV